MATAYEMMRTQSDAYAEPALVAACERCSSARVGLIASAFSPSSLPLVTRAVPSTISEYPPASYGGQSRLTAADRLALAAVRFPTLATRSSPDQATVTETACG